MTVVVHSTKKSRASAPAIPCGMFLGLTREDEEKFEQGKNYFPILVAYNGIHHYAPYVIQVQESFEDHLYTARNYLVDTVSELKKAENMLVEDTPFRQALLDITASAKQILSQVKYMNTNTGHAQNVQPSTPAPEAVPVSRCKSSEDDDKVPEELSQPLKPGSIGKKSVPLW